MPRRFSVHQLDNGLTVVFEFMPQTVSTTVGFDVCTGARYEPARLDGISHFLEHMVFKGTQKRTWQDINREFDQMGARYNAFTDYDETCYYAWVLNADAPRALELLTDMLAPTLPPAEFASEKKVVLEEIARYHDMPERAVFDAAMRAAFPGQRLSSTIIGSRKAVERLTREQMEAYYKSRYVPSNITLFACGNIDETALLAEIEKLWGERRGPRAPQELPTPVFQPGKNATAARTVTRHHVVMMWPSVPLEQRRNVAATLLGAVLGDEHNSRLHWALRHTGLAEDAGAAYVGFRDCGLIVAQLSCDPAKAARVKSVLRKEAAKLKRGITRQELQGVKNRTRTALVFDAETPFERFRQLVQEWTARRELLTPEEMLARVDAVTLDDLNQLLEECPLDARCAVAELGPPVRKTVTRPQAPNHKQGPNRQTKKKRRRPK